MFVSNISNIKSSLTLIGKGKGFSMAPIINEGDLIFIKKLNKVDYKINDIIVFKEKNILISHRIISTTKQNVVTKGDNSLVKDTPIKRNLVLGKVSLIQGKYGLLDLDCKTAKYINIYLFIYSMALYMGNKIVVVLIKKIFRGRRFLIRKLANNTI